MVSFMPVDGVPYRYDYPAIFQTIREGRRDARATYRELCRNDLFFLLYFGIERIDFHDPKTKTPEQIRWIVERLYEVQDNHIDNIDLWAREHYKSTFGTLGSTLQDIILNPDERVGIFSHTRPVAKGFLREIKLTLEGDVPIKRWFSDIFYANPRQQAPKWSEDDGLIVKRKSRAKEATFEAWGLVDGQPTSKHFTKRIYDDIVVKESVTTAEQIKKTQDAFELSHSLGTDGGSMSIYGTHYHFADLYTVLKRTAGYMVRVYPATDDGTATGRPVFLSPERLAQLRRDQGPYVFACQQLLNPIATEQQKFLPEWIKHYGTLPRLLNKYLLCDPANEKKKDNDYTVMAVIGIDQYKSRFLVDLVRKRLNLKERWEHYRDLWEKHRPVFSGYEKYGKDADISYFNQCMESEGIYFNIEELGGSTGKYDRMLRLVPWLESGQFYLPHRLIQTTKGKNIQEPDRVEDLIKIFIDEEYLFFPYSTHDDILDCIARIEDEKVGARAPFVRTPKSLPRRQDLGGPPI